MERYPHKERTTALKHYYALRPGRQPDVPPISFAELLPRLRLPPHILPFAPSLRCSDLDLLAAFWRQGEQASEDGGYSIRLSMQDLIQALRDSPMRELYGEDNDPLRNARAATGSAWLSKRINALVRRLKEKLIKLNDRVDAPWRVTLHSPRNTGTAGGFYTLRVRDPLGFTAMRSGLHEAFCGYSLPALKGRPLLLAHLDSADDRLSMDPARISLRAHAVTFSFPPLVKEVFNEALEALRTEPALQGLAQGALWTHRREENKFAIDLVRAAPWMLKVTEESDTLSCHVRGFPAPVTLRDYLEYTLGVRFCSGWADESPTDYFDKRGLVTPQYAASTFEGAVVPQRVRVQVNVVINGPNGTRLVVARRLPARGRGGGLQELIDADASQLFDHDYPAQDEEGTLAELQGPFLKRQLRRAGLEIDLPLTPASLVWSHIAYGFRGGGVIALQGMLFLCESEVGDWPTGSYLFSDRPGDVPQTLARVETIPLAWTEIAARLPLLEKRCLPGCFSGHLSAHLHITTLLRARLRAKLLDLGGPSACETWRATMRDPLFHEVRVGLQDDLDRYATLGGGEVDMTRIELAPTTWGHPPGVDLALWAITAPVPGDSLGHMTGFLGDARAALSNPAYLRPECAPWLGFPLEETRLELDERTLDWPTFVREDPELLRRFEEMAARFRAPAGGGFDGVVAFLRDFRVEGEERPNLHLRCVAGRYSQLRSMYLIPEDSLDFTPGKGPSDWFAELGDLYREHLDLEFLLPTDEHVTPDLRYRPLHPEVPRHLHLNALVITSEGQVVVPIRNPNATALRYQDHVVSVSQHSFLWGPKALPGYQDTAPVESGEALPAFDKAEHLDLREHYANALWHELGLFPSDGVAMRFLGLGFLMRRGGVWVPLVEIRLHSLTFADVKRRWGNAKDSRENVSLQLVPFTPEGIAEFLRGNLAVGISGSLRLALITSLRFAPEAFAVQGAAQLPETWRPTLADPESWLVEVASRQERLERYLSDPGSEPELPADWAGWSLAGER